MDRQKEGDLEFLVKLFGNHEMGELKSMCSHRSINRNDFVSISTTLEGRFFDYISELVVSKDDSDLATLTLNILTRQEIENLFIKTINQ